MPLRAPLVAQGGKAVALDTPVMVPEPEMGSDHMLINIGPQHPATHGVLRLQMELKHLWKYSSTLSSSGLRRVLRSL